MATTVARIPTSFKSQSTLLDELKAKDLTEGICQALREVKMIEEGKLKAKSIDELFDEL